MNNDGLLTDKDEGERERRWNAFIQTFIFLGKYVIGSFIR